MKRLLTLVVVLLACAPAYAADPALVNVTHGSDTASSPVVLTFGSTVASTSCVGVGIYLGAASGTVTSIADNKTGNVYTEITGHTLPVDDDNVRFWSTGTLAQGGASFQVTVNTSVNGRADLFEITNCAGVDVAATPGYSAGSGSPTSSNLTTNASTKDVVIGYYGTDTNVSGLSAGTGWSAPLFESGFRGAIHQDAVAPSTTLAPNGTFGSKEWTMLGIAFKGAAAGGSPMPPSGLTILGVGGPGQ